MRTKIAAIVLTAGLTAVGGAALVVPGSAFAATPSPSATSSPAASAVDRAAARVTAIKNALKGLVTDNTLTQAQADKVASALATSDALRGGRGGFGGRGHLNPETVAGILGLSPDGLRTQLQAGKTLAQIAATQSISKATLIDKLVAAAKTQLAADVKSGEITQAQSDAATSTLTAEVTKRVDEVHQGRGGRGEHGDQGGRDGHGDHGDADDQAPTGTTSPSASPSA